MTFVRTMGSGSFPGIKRPGRGVNHPPPSSAEVEERIEIYIYSLLWVFMACSRVNFTFTFVIDVSWNDQCWVSRKCKAISIACDSDTE
jgi:hypothetical protein